MLSSTSRPILGKYFYRYLDVHTSIHEERLLEDLFNTYNSAARPTIKDNETVAVRFGLTLSQIIDVVSLPRR